MFKKLYALSKTINKKGFNNFHFFLIESMHFHHLFLMHITRVLFRHFSFDKKYFLLFKIKSPDQKYYTLHKGIVVSRVDLPYYIEFLKEKSHFDSELNIISGKEVIKEVSEIMFLFFEIPDYKEEYYITKWQTVNKPLTLEDSNINTNIANFKYNKKEIILPLNCDYRYWNLIMEKSYSYEFNNDLKIILAVKNKKLNVICEFTDITDVNKYFLENNYSFRLRDNSNTFLRIINNTWYFIRNNQLILTMSENKKLNLLIKLITKQLKRIIK